MRWPRQRGRAATYLAITDHSASHGFGDHVTAERLWERIEEIRDRGTRASGGFRLLAGSEVNVAVDGSLDYSRRSAGSARLGRGQRPHLLLDLRGADDSADRDGDRGPPRRLHRPPHREADRQARDPYGVDIAAVIAAAAANGTMLEINGNPNRRDLKEGARATGSGCRRHDRPQHRRPRHRHARQHGLRGDSRPRCWPHPDQVDQTCKPAAGGTSLPSNQAVGEEAFCRKRYKPREGPPSPQAWRRSDRSPGVRTSSMGRRAEFGTT